MFFRKIPVIIEAVQIKSATFDNGFPFSDNPKWILDALENGTISIVRIGHLPMWQIKTLEDGPNGEAKHIAGPSDWIIKGVNGELYFCKPDIFSKTYIKFE